MVVHSFDRERRWFGDFVAFAELFGVVATEGCLHALPPATRTTVHVGWIVGDAAREEA
jgi:hypothetical protein